MDYIPLQEAYKDLQVLCDALKKEIDSLTWYNYKLQCRIDLLEEQLKQKDDKHLNNG